MSPTFSLPLILKTGVRRQRQRQRQRCFGPGVVHVGFVMDEVKAGQTFLQVLLLRPGTVQRRFELPD